MVTGHGRPEALEYVKHQNFVSPELDTIANQLAGRPALTQVGRVIVELGVTPIVAHSSQANGGSDGWWSPGTNGT